MLALFNNWLAKFLKTELFGCHKPVWAGSGIPLYECPKTMLFHFCTS